MVKQESGVRSQGSKIKRALRIDTPSKRPFGILFAIHMLGWADRNICPPAICEGLGSMTESPWACSRAATDRMNWNGQERTGSIRTPPTCCGTWMKSASGRRERERPEYSDGGWSAPLVTSESDALRRAIAGESFRESMN